MLWPLYEWLDRKAGLGRAGRTSAPSFCYLSQGLYSSCVAATWDRNSGDLGHPYFTPWKSLSPPVSEDIDVNEKNLVWLDRHMRGKSLGAVWTIPSREVLDEFSLLWGPDNPDTLIPDSERTLWNLDVSIMQNSIHELIIATSMNQSWGLNS